MKTLLTFLFLLISIIGNAATYYVSSSDGNNSDSGLTEALAWQTVSKVNSSTFSAGDSILFKKGDVWREQLIFPSNGSVGNPIVISSYGTGAKPMFSSTIYAPDWGVPTGGVYSVSKSMSIYYVFWEDDKAHKMATSSACTDGIWFYSSGTLYYKPTSGVASDHVINLVNTDWANTYTYFMGIKVSDRQYVTINGLQFKTLGIGIGSYDGGAGTNSIRIENCDFYNCVRGIFFMPDDNDNTNAIICNNYFKWCQNAICMYTTTATGFPENIGSLTGQNINCSINNNEVDECGTTDGITLWTYGSDREAFGVQQLQSCSIYNNYVHGGNCIGFIIYNQQTKSSDDNLVYNNYFLNTGAPFVFTGTTGHYGFNNNIISYNLVVNPISAYTVTWNNGITSIQYNKFVNNTFIGTSSHFKLFVTNGSAQYLSIRNNIIYGSQTYKFRCDGLPTNLIMDYNLYYSTLTANYVYNGASRTTAYMQGLGYDVNSVYFDPLFVSISDFHLRPTSPAINAGDPTILDADGSRSDIGAFPYVENSYMSVTENGKYVVLDGKIVIAP